MIFASVLWLSGIFLFVISILPPLFQYVKSTSATQLQRPDTEHIAPITVLLPARNESGTIVRKLKEIVNLDYPKNMIKILVVISGKSDNSETLARNFLEDHASDIEWRIEVLEKLGKTLAINYAMEKIDTDLFVMMDADASVPRDSLIRLISWFSDPSIGGVSGCLSIDNIDDREYRKRSNLIRAYESSVDSTPIFEGSLCAIRKDSLGSKQLDDRINADDSQMAINIRRNGYRAVIDSDIKFIETLDYKRPMTRKIRRAQGLTRIFWKNRDLCYGWEKYSKLFRSQFYFHLFFPWLLILSLLIIYSSSSYWIYQNRGVSANLHGATIFSFPVLVFSNTARQAISGASSLVISQLLLVSGKRLNVWEPDRTR